MIQVIPSNQRYHFESDWLSTYWHFSFDDYYDPENVSFGPLRVFNDDVIKGGGGFPMHPHREMEIITIPLSGSLEHRDSVGNHGVIAPGEVQRMSAGTGIRHSEFNASQTEPVHLLQIWVMPGVKGLKPSWEQKKFPLEARQGRFLPVATGSDELLATSQAVKIHQDAAFYLASIRPGKTLDYQLAPSRRAYVFVPEGSTALGTAAANGHKLTSGDVARIIDENYISFKADEPTDILLIDLP